MRRTPGVFLVSLVSVSARNWCYLCERIERVEKGETVEIANVHAGVMHVAENMLGKVIPKALDMPFATSNSPQL